jgi:hypothetical protein
MTLSDLLIRAGVDYRSGRGGEVTLCCPFCTDSGYPEDTKFHLGLNVDLGLAHCFRCGWKMRGVSETGRALAGAWEVPVTGMFRRARLPAKKPKAVMPEETGAPEEYEPLAGDTDVVAAKVRQYLESRSISMLQIVRHRIGYAATGAMSWRALFPVLDGEGKIYGCVGRAVTRRQSPRYLNTPGIKLLWNGWREGGTAVLCEGVMDALAVERAVLVSGHMVAVATLGSALTQTQFAQLKKFERVIVLPDFDEAGIGGAIKICGQCADNKIKTAVVVPEVLDGSDPAATEERTLVERIEGAQNWSLKTEYRLRMAKTRPGVFA